MSGRSKVFYGWWVVAAASLGLFFGGGPIMVLSFGVFLKALTQDFHASRAAISFAFSLHNILGALSTPLIGRLIDSAGARKVILVGTTIFGIALLSAQFVPPQIAYLYLFYFPIGLMACCTSPVPYGTVVARWFERRRGLALGLMGLGLGLGAIFVPFVAQRLIARFGWRTAFVCLGGAVLLISLPVVATILAENPRKKGLLPDGIVQNPESSKTLDEGFVWHDIWHHPTFWLMIAVFALAGASVFACIIHLPALLTDRGLNAQTAAIGSSLVGLAVLTGRVGAGYLLDRFFAPRIAMLCFGISALGIALLWAGTAGTLALIAGFFIGVGMGAEVDIIAFLMARYFGLRSLGTSFAYGFASYGLAGALGVYLMGAGFDRMHSYSFPLGGFFMIMVLAVALLSQLGPYRYSAPHAENDRQMIGVSTEGHA
jgi:MFS family permease